MRKAEPRVTCPALAQGHADDDGELTKENVPNVGEMKRNDEVRQKGVAHNSAAPVLSEVVGEEMPACLYDAPPGWFIPDVSSPVRFRHVGRRLCHGKRGNPYNRSSRKRMERGDGT